MTRDVAGYAGEDRPPEQAARFDFAHGLVCEAGVLALRYFKDFATLQVFRPMPRTSSARSMPQQLQRALMEAFALGRVSVDGCGDVFEARAHFDRQAEHR
jgi:hypothetical protein